MPVVDKGARILVTGANGYIAMWVVRILLERGFFVRGTVRSVDKGKHVIEYFTSLGYGDKIEVVVVEDMAKEGAFDEAIKGMDAIIHTASPAHGNVGDPQEFLVPATQGTIGILKSAVNSQVRRIVVTSSAMALLSSTAPPSTIYTELDWNEQSIQLVEQLGKNSPPTLIYPASKTLAEKCAWAFYEEHKSEVQWDLTTIIPPFVFGPLIQQMTSVADMNASMKGWYFSLLAEPQIIMNFAGSWVDVRDCALGHVLSLEKDAAGGERIIVASSDSWVLQDWVDAVNMVLPSLSCKLPVGVLGDQTLRVIRVDNSKQDRILGLKFRTKLETAKDIIEDIAKKGWCSRIASIVEGWELDDIPN